MCVWCSHILFWLALLNCIHFFFISSWTSPGNFLLISATLSQNVFAYHHIWRLIFRIQDLGWTSLLGRYKSPSGEEDWLCIHVCSCNFSYSFIIIYLFSSLQLLSHVRLFVIPWTAIRQASMSITNFQSLLKLMSIDSVMPSNHLILCHPLLLLPSILPSIRVFSNESSLHIRWPKYWSFSFSISSSNEYSGLISFRMDWLDVLAVQGTLKSFL